MAPKSLSRTGCWTCRIRHMKCDESRPECGECESRAITCHGYGTKPSWLDDPVQLRREVSRLKNIIKNNLRHRLQKRRGKTVMSNGSELIPEASVPGMRSGIVIPASAGDTDLERSRESVFREAELSMYYLDAIFPILFPYYEWDLANGGRGWLFWLLTQNVPMRQAALSLAALHQRAGVLPGVKADETELLEYHTKALAGLRKALCDTDGEYLIDNPDQMIYVIACGCSLISFEVCQGSSNQWQSHLRALVSIACDLSPSMVSSIKRGKRAPATDVAVTSRPKSGLEPGRRRAMDFFVAQILWYELLACASTGAEPRMPYRTWLSAHTINMVDLMGCEHWVLAVIGDIALVDVRRARLEKEKLCSMIRECEARLQNGIERLKVPKVDDNAFRSHSSNFRSDLRGHKTFYITSAFAMAAQLFLLALKPIEDSAQFEDAPVLLTKLTEIFDRASKVMSLRGLVWPICIAGSMADKSQQPMFEHIMELVKTQGDASFGNCETVMKILGCCWQDRRLRREDVLPWREAMIKSGNYVLLI